MRTTKVLLLAILSLLISDVNSQTFQWAKVGGEPGGAVGNNIAVDAQGNSYVTGYFLTTADFDGIVLTSNGGQDIYVAKYNTNGVIQWVLKAGGIGDDAGNDISLDASGNIYITGKFHDTATFGTSTLISSGNTDVFVAKCNSAGQWLWVIKGGSTDWDEGSAISTDNAGNSYITGYIRGTSTFGNSTVNVYSGASDILIAKCNSNGVWLWADHAGGGNWDFGNGISVDGNGNIYITGSFQDYGGYPVYFGSNILYATPGGSNMFVAKYDNAGNNIWVVKGDGPGVADGTDIAADIYGNSYVLGIFYDTASFNGLTLIAVAPEGSWWIDDYFFAKYDSDGNLKWIHQLGGAGYFKGNGVTLGTEGEVFITGTFDGTVTIIDTTLTSSGYDNMYVALFDTAGTFYWVKKADGNYYHATMGISDGTGNAYITGFFYGIATFNCTTFSTITSGNMFITKLNDFIHTGVVAETNFCPGETVMVPFTSKKPCNPQNVYTAQLSDITGCFNNPVNIGTLNDYGTSGVITAAIPQNTPNGTTYRIRVISSNPLIIGADNGTNLTIYPLPVANAGANTTIIAGDSVQIGSSPVSGYTYLWSPATGLSSATVANPWAKPETSRYYYLTVKNTYGCTKKDSVFITTLGTDCESAIELIPAITCMFYQQTVTAGTTEMWYKFIATSDSVTVNTIQMALPVTAQPIIEIYGYSGSCDSLIQLSQHYANLTIGGLIIGDTYYIRVYQLNMTDFGICITKMAYIQPPSFVLNDSIILKITQPSQTFESIRNDADSFYIPLRAANGGNPTKGEKFFRRWEYHVANRFSYPGAPVGGSFSGLATYMSAVAKNNFNVCNSGPATSPWTSIGQNPTPSDKQDIGIIISVAVDPGNNNVIYAGSNTAGVWKTTNGGATWTNKTDGLGVAGLGINAVTVDPNNSNNVLAGTGTRSYGYAQFFPDKGIGVIKSTDGGNNWATTNIASFPGDFLNIEVIKYHPTDINVVYAAANKKIYKSTDGGSTWTTIFTNPTSVKVSFIDLEFNILNPSIIYASTDFAGDGLIALHGAQLFVSTNGGATWVARTPPNTIIPGVSVSDAIAIDVTPADQSTVYVMYQNGSQQFVRKSTDNGNTWTLINQFSPLWCWGYWVKEFEVSNVNTNVFYAGACTMHKSINSGATWTSISQYYPVLPAINSTHADIRALIQLPSLTGDFLVMGNDGGVAKTTNGGTLWTNINGNGLIITQFYAFGSFNSNNNLVGGTQDNGTKFKNGATNVWSSFVLYGDGGWTEVNFANENIVYASIYDWIHKSINGGLNYSNISNPGGGQRLWRKFHLDPSNPNRLWYGFKDLYVYNEPTNSWTLKYAPPSTWVDNAGDTIRVTDITAINVAPSNGNIVYIAYFGPTWGHQRKYNLLKTTDGGANWTDLSQNFPAYDWTHITDFEIDPTNPNRIWASCANYWYISGNTAQGENRVIFSNNGGITWIDASIGLPPFPVNCLAYQNGTDDVIYAGTDAGVYRWNKPLQTWECFNNGLPAAIITKIEINNCKNKILASTFGRGIWEAPLPQAAEYHITTSQTWDALYNRSFNTNVVVDPGKTLTIKGTVNFAENMRLIIMPNAKVIVDGGKLTNRCGGMWQGVHVGGNGNQPQTLSGGLALYQGIIEMKNNAIIENARNGITTGLVDQNGDFIWTSFGGIIRAANSKFLNNKRDIQFMSYPNYNNISYFTNCLFEVNQLLAGGNIPETRVSMWNVKNVNFRGCNFKYSAGNTYPSLSRGYGIYSIDAKYNVGDYCTGLFISCPPAYTIQSKFENWDYGIWSQNSNVLMNANINHVKFINNGFGGAKLSGMHYPVFNSCEVQVGNGYQSYGLYLESCKYYKTQNNNFTNTTGNTDDIGIYVRNSSYGAHEIYRNNFNNLTVGIGAMDNNSDYTSPYQVNYLDGLKMNCNIFNNGQYDVAEMTYYGPTSVAFVQGLGPNPSTMVRNYYTAPCGNENKWYIDGSNKQVIHGCHSGSNTAPLPQTSCSDLYVNIATYSVLYDYATQCPNNLNNDISVIKQKILIAKTELPNLKLNYASLIDGGNTQSLFNAINSNMSPGNRKNLLISKSPYISDAVLLAYINKTQTPPNGHLKEVVVANSPVTEQVKQAINNLNLPNGIKQEINNAQTGISERFKLEGEIILKNFDIQSLVSEEISYYLNDTLDVTSIDSVLYLIKTENRPHAACELVQTYIYKGDYVKAGEILDTLQTNPALSDFCVFQRLIIELNQAVEKCYYLKVNTAKKQEVEAIANDEEKETACQAQALLKQVFEYTYPEIKLLPVQQSYRMMQVNNEETWTDINDSLYLFQSYPNPAKDNITFLFKAPDNSFAMIEIRDVTGRLIDVISVKGNSLQNYSTDKLTNTIYFATLYVDNKLIKQQKIVLVK